MLNKITELRYVITSSALLLTKHTYIYKVRTKVDKQLLLNVRINKLFKYILKMN